LNTTTIELFKQIFYQYLKVLVTYADGADKLRKLGKNMDSVTPFVQSVTDNKQRMMDFLLAQNILIDEKQPG